MQKVYFEVLSGFYGIDSKALKEKMKKENIKVSEASKRDVLNTMFLYAPELMYSRDIGNGIVEYLYPKVAMELAEDLARANKESYNEK